MPKGNLVELLYTDECPFWKETLKLINEIVNDSKLEITLKKVRVLSEKDAKRLKFPGSPTVRINGVDIDPAIKEIEGYVGCRIYMYKGHVYEYPPKEMIKSAFETLLRKQKLKIFSDVKASEETAYVILAMSMSK